MKILVVTGIYPPDIGGPAQYAKNIVETWRKEGYEVKVLFYGLEKKLPTGLRHILFFFRTLFALSGVDFVLALDTFSVGMPATFAAKVAGKKIIIRTGGDFLWEGYVERTGDLVLLKDFYTTRISNFSAKEKLIFKLTRWTLRNVSAVVWSTFWQKDIFTKAYGLEGIKSFIVENYYGPKLPSLARAGKNFIGATRPLKWKNTLVLKRAFEKAKEKNSALSLDLENVPYEVFVQKVQSAYAVILVSLGDVSPNLVLDALRANTPVILTRETGLYEKLKDVVMFVDPQDESAITEAILSLSRDDVYAKAKQKVEAFTFVHDWKEIAGEFVTISKSL